MKKEYQKIITELLGVEPIEINSAIVSAQNRRRLYWTNIEGVSIPKDKKVFISDIVQPIEDVDPQYIISDKWLEWFRKNGSERIKKKLIQIDGLKTICVTARQYANWSGNFLKVSKDGYPKKDQLKASCLTGGAHSGGNHSDMDLLLAENFIRRYTPIECERLQTVPDNYTEGVSDTQRYKMLGNGWNVDTIVHIFKNLKK